MHISYYYYMCSSLQMKLKVSHYTQELSIYMNRQDRLAFESIGCYEGKEGQSVEIGEWWLWKGSVGGECGGNYSRADRDPCFEP